ncbi:MAG: hypothetical protein APR63_03635 [Desulfuromonas sp. SDB]|nr:MAG: hypothetical protein APR63_03635 [Desulfuromonas sp. SDB]
MFGEFVKKMRLEKDLSLREFCRRIDEDPSNWSKIERGILNPPKEETLAKIAEVLDIKKDSEQWKKLIDLSQISSATIPSYIMENKEVLNYLPAFFRTVESVKPTKEEIESLIESLKKTRE